MVQTEKELYELMAKKLEILQKICTNTRVQIRFIKQRKLKGLHRLLDERAQYLQELAAFNDEFDYIIDNCMKKWTFDEELKQMHLAIRVKEREIIGYNDEALKVANAERDQIMTDLRNVRNQKSLINCYNHHWLKFTGKRLNRQG